MDTTKAVTHVSLCAGYGGIDLGLKRAIPDLRTIAFSEIEAFACANLVAKMEAGQLDPAPIWTNLKTFPWSSFRGKVGILSGGYPCQPFSAAGKRLGADDPRHLWPFIAAGIAAMRPRLCFFENVEGHISLGLKQVLRDLQGLGYRCTFGVFSASEVGATHQRKRLFILAHDTSVGVQGYWAGRIQESFAHAGERLPLRGGHCWPSRPGQPQFYWEPPRVVGNEPPILGNTKSERTRGLPIRTTERQPGSAIPSVVSEIVADAKRDGSGKGGQLCAGPDGQQPVSDGEARGTDGMGNTRVQESRWLPSGSGRNEALEARQSGGTMGDTDSRGQSPSLNAGSSSQADGRRQSDLEPSERWQTKPALGGDTHGSSGRLDYAELCISGDSRVDELRLLGNGVVPATAERAFNVLASRLFL